MDELNEQQQITIDNFYENEDSFLNQRRKRSTKSFDKTSSLPTGRLGGSPTKLFSPSKAQNEEFNNSRGLSFPNNEFNDVNALRESPYKNFGTRKNEGHYRVMDEFLSNESNNKLFESILEKRFKEEDEEEDSNKGSLIRNSGQKRDSMEKSDNLDEKIEDDIPNDHPTEYSKEEVQKEKIRFSYNKDVAFPDEDSRTKSDVARKKAQSIHGKSLKKKALAITSFLEAKAFPRLKKDPLAEIEEEDLKELQYKGDLKELESRLILQNFFQFENLEVLRCRELDIISEKYIAKEESIGRPRLLHITPKRKYLIIGTSLGLITLFDFSNESFKWFGNASDLYQYGSVTALDVSYDEEFLVSGHENGALCAYEMSTGKLIKVFSAIHKTAVLSIKFFHDKGKSLASSKAISSDSIGQLFKLTFEKSIFTFECDKQLLLEKTVGQISQIEVYQGEIFSTNPKIKHTKIVGISSMSKVFIIQMEPRITILYKMVRPDYIDERNPAVFSWCEHNANPTDEYQPVEIKKAIVVWDKTLFLLCVTIDHTNWSEPFSISIIGRLNLETPIIYTSFLSVDTIFLFSETKKVFLISLNDFLTALEELNLESPGTMALFPAKEYFLFKKEFILNPLLLDTSGKPKQHYLSAIFTLKLRNSVFIMGEDYYLELSLDTWDRHLDRLVERSDWLIALKTSIRIYNGETKFLAGISSGESERKKMETYMCDLAKTYVMVHAKGDIDEVATVVTEYLITTKNTNYLFTEIINIFKNFGYLEQFLNSLELFILKNQLREIPDSTLRQIVAYFKSQKKLDVVQMLILSLELKNLDSCPIITLCLEFHLFRGLIYICTIGDGDFLTPVIKLFNLYEATKSKSKEEAHKLGYRCLWYLKMSLEGKLINGKSIDESSYAIMVQQLVLWTFVKENIISLIEIDIRITFKLFLMYFTGKPAEIIKLNHSKIKISLPDDTKKPEIKDKDAQKFIPHNKMIQLILSCEEDLINKIENPQEITCCLKVFVAKLIDFGVYSLPHKKCVESCLLLLKSPGVVFNLEDTYLEKTELDSEEDEIRMSELIIKIIQYMERICPKVDFSEVFKLVELTRFCKVNAYLYSQKEDFKRCFDTFLLSKNKLIKKSLFDWLNEKMEQWEKIQDSSSLFSDMKAYILLKLTDLVTIDSKMTHDIINRFNKNAEKSVVKYLAPNPNLQIEYLEKILLTRETGAAIDNDLLVTHIELLCKEKNERKLIKMLRSWDYPLDESLKLCKKYQMDEATAYLMERTGAVDQALDMYIQIFVSTFEKCITSMEKSKKSEPDILTEKIDVIIDLCNNYKNFDITSSEVLWFKFLDKLIEVRDIFSVKLSDDKYKDLNETYKSIFSKVFNEISKNISFDLLVTKIKEKYGGLSLAYLKKTFIQMISNFRYEKNILNNAKTLTIRGMNYETMNLRTESFRGYNLKPICQKCERVYDFRNMVVLYYCGHSFHRSCSPQQFCVLCSQEDAYNFFMIVLNSKYRMDKISAQKKRNEEIPEPFDPEWTNVNSKNPPVFDEKQYKLEERRKKLAKLKQFERRVEEEMILLENAYGRYEDI